MEELGKNVSEVTGVSVNGLVFKNKHVSTNCNVIGFLVK